MAFAIASRTHIKVNGVTMPDAGKFAVFFNNDFCRRLWVTFGRVEKKDIHGGISGNKAVIIAQDLQECVLTDGSDSLGNYLASFTLND